MGIIRLISPAPPLEKIEVQKHYAHNTHIDISGVIVIELCFCQFYGPLRVEHKRTEHLFYGQAFFVLNCDHTVRGLYSCKTNHRQLITIQLVSLSLVGLGLVC